MGWTLEPVKCTVALVTLNSMFSTCNSGEDDGSFPDPSRPPAADFPPYSQFPFYFFPVFVKLAAGNTFSFCLHFTQKNEPRK